MGAVDPGTSTLTVLVRGGNARPRVTPTAVVVPATAAVVVDGVTSTLAAVQPGQSVLVKGVKVGTTVTITRVEATTTPAV